MDERRGSTDRRHEATRYEIRLKGRLDSSWADRLGGMSLTHASDGTTVLTGPVADQAALHGLLQKLRDIGVALISVNETEAVSQTGANRGCSAAGRGTPAGKADHGGIAPATPPDPTTRRST